MGKWLVSETELDKEQKNFINTLQIRTGNRCIEGFPGSGKTVLLLYAADRFKKMDKNASIVFIEFTHSLLQMMRAALDELNMNKEYDDIPVETYYEFCDRDHNTYDYILCDEVQDLPTRVIRAMASRARKLVIIAGDRNQSIYPEDPKWKEKACDPSSARSILNVTESDKLVVLHRLTPTIIKAVNCFMPDMDILGGRRSMMKTDTDIRLWKGRDRMQEIKAVAQEAMACQRSGKSVGILFRYHKGCISFIRLMLECLGKPTLEDIEWKYERPDYLKINEHMDKCGLPFHYVGNSTTGEKFTDNNKITLMTYNGSKGLDFDCVFLPFMGTKSIPPFSTAEMEKKLLMVAITRSRQDLYISYTYSLDNNISTFSKLCKFRDLGSIDTTTTTTVGTSSDNDDDDEFA